MWFACLSAFDLKTVCACLQRRYELPPFEFDIEIEGQDWWEYGTSRSAKLSINVTRIGRFVNVSSWTWMWRAPDRANYQIIISSDADAPSFQESLAEVLECEVEQYPNDYFQSPRSGRVQ
jgi:hypothetical protein